ncbi:hypothetical protein B0H14DRAFT_2640385 [Mycena olivaceomarginata]|nr:hypothetical protein B0H14DRAFT_2640385 [Mycena olivaceomarginata]
MPVSVTKPSIKWLEYLETIPPPCPHKPLPDNLKSKQPPRMLDIERTHSPSSSSLAACGAETALTRSNHILTKFVANNVNLWLAGDETRIIPEEDYYQPLLNEQAVAYVPTKVLSVPQTLSVDFREVYFKTVLAPVKQALEMLLKQLLTREDLTKAGYFFNIRQQQGSPTKDNRTRCDHYLVLEHKDGIDKNGDADAPRKIVLWRDPQRFAKMLKERVKWEADPTPTTGAAPEYPSLVLCVIEEKKPNVIREDDFVPEYAQKAIKNDVGARNVSDFLPPVKKYSVDAQCKLVILTDYHTTLLLDVEEAGAIFDEHTLRITKVDRRPKVAVGRLKNAPRLTLFSVAVKRLMDANLIKIE